MSGNLIRLQFTDLPVGLLLRWFIYTIKLSSPLLPVCKEPQLALYVIVKGKSCQKNTQPS